MSKEQVKITATQKKKHENLKDYQIDILESMEKMKTCDIIISITKHIPKKGEPTSLRIGYNGKRLIPLKK